MWTGPVAGLGTAEFSCPALGRKQLSKKRQAGLMALESNVGTAM